MPRAKKEVVDDNEINEKTKMDLENINPNKKKSKKVVDVVEDSKLKKEKPKEDKKEKPKEEKDMTGKDLKKELKAKDKEIHKIKTLINKINELI